MRQRHRNNRRKTLRGGWDIPVFGAKAQVARAEGNKLRKDYQEAMEKLLEADPTMKETLQDKNSVERQKWIRDQRGLKSFFKGSFRNIGKKRTRRKEALEQMNERLKNLGQTEEQRVAAAAAALAEQKEAAAAEMAKAAADLAESKQSKSESEGLKSMEKAKAADDKRKQTILDLNAQQVDCLATISKETKLMQESKSVADVEQHKQNITEATAKIKDLYEQTKVARQGTEGAEDAQLLALKGEFEKGEAHHDMDVLEKLLGKDIGLLVASEEAKDLKVPNPSESASLRYVLEVIDNEGAELLNPERKQKGKKGGSEIHWSAPVGEGQHWVKLKKSGKKMGTASRLFVPQIDEAPKPLSDEERKVAENEIIDGMEADGDVSYGEGVIFKVNALGASVRKGPSKDAEKRNTGLEKGNYIRVTEKKKVDGQSFYKTDRKIGTLVPVGKSCTEWMSEGIKRDFLQKKDCIFTFADEELRKEGTKDVKILKGSEGKPIYVIRGDKLFFTNCHVKLVTEGRTHSDWGGKKEKPNKKAETGTSATFKSQNTKEMTAAEIYSLFWGASIKRRDHGQFRLSEPSSDSPAAPELQIARHEHAVDLLAGRGKERPALAAFYYEPELPKLHHGDQRHHLFEKLIEYAIGKAGSKHEVDQLGRLLEAYNTAFTAAKIEMGTEEEAGRYLMATKEVADTLNREIQSFDDLHGRFTGYVKDGGARIHLGAAVSPCNGIDKLLLSPEEIEITKMGSEKDLKEKFGCEPYPLLLPGKGGAKSSKDTADDRRLWGPPHDDRHERERKKKINEWDAELKTLKEAIFTLDKQQELPPNAIEYTARYRKIIKLNALKVSYQKSITKENSIGMTMDMIPGGSAVMGITIASYAGIMKKFLETMGLDDKLYLPPLKSYHYVRNIKWAKMENDSGAKINAANMEWKSLDPDCCVRTDNLTMAEPGSFDHYVEIFKEWMKTTVGKIAIGGLKSVLKKGAMGLLKNKLGSIGGFIGILGAIFGIIASPVGVGIIGFGIVAGVAVAAKKKISGATAGGGRRKRNNKRTKTRKKQKRAKTRTKGRKKGKSRRH